MLSGFYFPQFKHLLTYIARYHHPFWFFHPWNVSGGKWTSSSFFFFFHRVAITQLSATNNKEPLTWKSFSIKFKQSLKATHGFWPLKASALLSSLCVYKTALIIILHKKCPVHSERIFECEICESGVNVVCNPRISIPNMIRSNEFFLSPSPFLMLFNFGNWK